MLLRDIRALGALCYTAGGVRRSRERGNSGADRELDRSLRLEVIADEAVRAHIAEHVLVPCCANSAVSMFVAGRGVLRPQKD